MAPHLCGAELDMVTKAVGKGKEAAEILAAISQKRRKSKIAVPKIWDIRRAIAGLTHKRGVQETRGRKKKLNQVQVNRMFAKRKAMIHPAAAEYYVSDGQPATRLTD